MSLTELSQDPSQNFLVEEDRKNELKSGPPDCILAMYQKAPPLGPEKRIDLTDQELVAAYERLWNKKFCDLQFPRTRKFRVDPLLSGQSHGIISFMPSAGAKPDKQGCYGVLKLRGNFANEFDAERYGAMLMRKYDSFAEYDVVRVGQEFPLMDSNDIYTTETREVNIKAIMDDVSLSFIRKKKEQERQERQEVEERARRLVSGDTAEDKENLGGGEDLEFYTVLRTKKAHCQHVIDEAKRRIVEAEQALVKICEDIADMDVKYPTYKKDYIAQYDRALRSIGTDVNKNPLVQYMKKDADAAAAEEAANEEASAAPTQA